MSAMLDIVMPKLGLTMTEGTIESWKVQPGAKVAAGDVIFVVEIDKSTTEIEARTDGVIESIVVAEGETADVGAVVATMRTQ